MRIVLVNIPHPAIGSRIPDDHLPPLGLLAVGGPLLDDGHQVHLIDGELGPAPLPSLVEEIVRLKPNAVLFGHSGSTSGHPIIAHVSAAVSMAAPCVKIIYGGVFPSYHWREILQQEPHVDAIVRGEGEETARQLIRALQGGTDLQTVRGIAYQSAEGPKATQPAPVIHNLDAYRIGWELIDHTRYSYWGGMRAVVAQFSRGCPHQCTYCGQRGFWTRWRHRDPVLFAKELARLHREQGVELINFADENPTTSRKAWRAFLEALIAENVNLTLIGTTRAGDIVRDADILHLYRKAGWTRFLLGLDAVDSATLSRVRKGATAAIDAEAIRLLRQHEIISLASWVVGFEEETDRDYWRGLRQLLAYDPDQIQMMYATPHRWTPYYREESRRRVIQLDRSKWDYKHQVLATRHMPAWRVILWFKTIEAILQGRPKALYRTYLHPAAHIRRGMRWYSRMGRRVWPYEILNFLRDPIARNGPTLSAFWGAPQDHSEQAMSPRPHREPPDPASASHRKQQPEPPPHSAIINGARPH
ncbi:MAG: magnesium-protoporphyrin IX monomethyl ester anaerobic oxidative cyclase [Rhodobacteraceae bacterium]|nr:magnesium-protoporphyrin IX monomethyl ester anaerobic oxidative cyclase [Paracoccaceae bacterium]